VTGRLLDSSKINIKEFERRQPTELNSEAKRWEKIVMGKNYTKGALMLLPFYLYLLEELPGIRI
jgi:hypothetical protein